MAPEEDVRSRLRRQLGEEYGMEEADVLLDRPQGGWDALVTREVLHLELSALGSQLRYEMANGRAGWTAALSGVQSSFDHALRVLTWSLVCAIGVCSGIIAVIIKL